MQPYVYIVVRSDIKKEYQLVQACHSVLEAGLTFNRPDKGVIHLVVLEVENKWDLEGVAYKLENENIKYEIFHESFGDMGFTSLATEPILKPDEGILRSLPLLCY
jgi:hypothetical protein